LTGGGWEALSGGLNKPMVGQGIQGKESADVQNRTPDVKGGKSSNNVVRYKTNMQYIRVSKTFSVFIFSCCFIPLLLILFAYYLCK
jgi:hypothetical protein